MLAPIAPQAQQTINELIQDSTGQLNTFPFPQNIAGVIPLEMRQRIYRWMLATYIWPQVQERKAYEQQWDKLLSMVRAAWKLKSQIASNDEDTRLARRMNARLNRLDAKDGDSESSPSVNERIEISDTVIFDAVDRLTNLNHFICFKESLPVSYDIPEDVVFPMENEVYSPTSALVKSANGWLKFNARSQDVYRKGWMSARHHYTYGVSFCCSEFVQKISPVPRRLPNKTFQNKLELTEIGITFEPMSIRKLWLNPRLSVYKMEYQPCPFFFEEMPRFATVANVYDQQTNPFGFANTDKLPKAQYLFGSAELESWAKAWQEASGCASSPQSLMSPDFNIELLWTFFPMLPLGIDQTLEDDPENPNKLVFDDKGTLGIPLSRWIMQTFGNNLGTGAQEIVRLQRNFYPNDDLPLYGSAHMPTLDDGAYSMAIGTVLENHYIQICKAMMQYIENKDWINDPPSLISTSSPAMAHDINKKGAKIPVLTPNDVTSRPPYDATQTTPTVLNLIREQAQTSSKAVDAILGKAMGSRTSATEASNVFQTAMSGVTTDINLFSYDIYGGYATKVWDYTGLWVAPEILQAITGSYGFAIKPEHMAIRLGLKWDTGSSFIESLTRQQNYRYLLESSQPGDPSVNRAYLMKALLREWKMKDVDLIINDGGLEDGILLCTQQAIETYLGKLVIIDPDQDHNLGIKILKSFLQDHKSIWNTNPQYSVNGPKLVQMIQIHMQFLQMQMLQQQLMQRQQGLAQGDPLQPLNPPSPSAPPSAKTPGQARQETGQ